MNIKGNKTERHRDNPIEELIHDKFLELHGSWKNMERIALPSNGYGHPVGMLNEREVKIILSTIQWLGSPVGQGFLEDCGFTYEDITNKTNSNEQP